LALRSGALAAFFLTTRRWAFWAARASVFFRAVFFDGAFFDDVFFDDVFFDGAFFDACRRGLLVDERWIGRGRSFFFFFPVCRTFVAAIRHAPHE